MKWLTWNNVRLALMLPLIVLDCLGNMLVCRNSWRTTMSAEAWRQRNSRWFGWCWKAIDAMPWFGKGHCQRQSELEEKHGNVWAAWLASFQRRA